MMLFGKFSVVVNKITGYLSVPGSGLAVAELEALRVAYLALNMAVSDAEVTLEAAIATWSSLYKDEDTGLSARMKAIKKAVRSQYKATSAEYAQVKGIKL